MHFKSIQTSLIIRYVNLWRNYELSLITIYTPLNRHCLDLKYLTFYSPMLAPLWLIATPLNIKILLSSECLLSSSQSICVSERIYNHSGSILRQGSSCAYISPPFSRCTTCSVSLMVLISRYTLRRCSTQKLLDD